jgi:hypothetical protein
MHLALLATDLDHDGWLDLAVTNMGVAAARTSPSSSQPRGATDDFVIRERISGHGGMASRGREDRSHTTAYFSHRYAPRVGGRTGGGELP